MNQKSPKTRALLLALVSIISFAVLPAQAQDATAAKGKAITISFEGKKLNAALDEVERQSGYYRIQYVMNDVAAYTVKATLSNATVETAVRTLLAATPLKYNIDGRFIHVYNPAKSIGG